ncbi:Protein MAIN-LIKE 2 [Linum perenne]
MNTFHLIQGEATITLEDVEVLTGLPTRGLPVTARPDRRTPAAICQEWLDVKPPTRAISGATLKVSWVKGLFNRLPAGAPPRGCYHLRTGVHLGSPGRRTTG